MLVTTLAHPHRPAGAGGAGRGRPRRARPGAVGASIRSCRCRWPWARSAGRTSNNFLLVAIPFFVLLGEILLRSGMAERMYNALVLWIPWLPGGLMHSNIAACAMFAATSGSSVATAATIGTVAMGEIEKRGYSERLFLGTIAAGGTLGILIPPSINMIVYGVLTDTSIPKLYLAGFIPGIVLAGLFSLTVLLICSDLAAARRQADIGHLERSASRALPDLHPAAGHLPRRDRLDLCRLGDRDRGGGARRGRRRSASPRANRPADADGAAARLRGHDAHHGHDHGHHASPPISSTSSSPRSA